MENRRRFRFGAKATKATSSKEWSEIARRAEDLGFVSLQIDDHFGSQLAPLPACMAAAAATTTLQVGTLVAGNDFRNPMVLAQEAATIDLLSDGRFVLGLGAGWLASDYHIAGIEQADARTRIARMAETVAICRGIWSGEPFSFEGEHYRIAEVTGYPRPVSTIPVLIGGGGKEVLSLAARQADIVGINPKIVARGINPRSMATAAADAVDQRIGWIQEAAGDHSDDLELQLQVFVTVVTDDRQATAEKLAPALGLPPEVVLTAPYFQIGPVELIADNLRDLRDRWGISYIAFQQDATEAVAPVVAQLAGT
jgi:probable F420-dependent oxidoreductase